MNVQTSLYKSQELFIKNSQLILIAFATSFFPRIINSIGFPPVVNFVHFAVVPLCCGIAIFTSRPKLVKQIYISKLLMVGLFIILICITLSALLNRAGVINAFLSFMLLAEPFILLLAIIVIPMSMVSLDAFRTWIIRFGIINIFLAICQHFLISFGLLAVRSMQPVDNVQGVFYLSGSGHVVSASVSMSLALFNLKSKNKQSLLIRILIFIAAFMQLLFADAKQVVIVWFIAAILLIIINAKDLKTTLQYGITLVLSSIGLWWCINNLAIFSAFKTWIRPELYGLDGLATRLKLAPFQIIPSYYESILNWLFGLGPGHTIGRLGGWMLKDYASLLQPLGATTHPASQAVWETYRGNWLNSTFFSPLWGWAGVWGDLGIIGLGAYIFLFGVTWFYICSDNFARLTLITMIIFGFIVTQMEEPGYMLSMTALIGLRWHESNTAKYIAANTRNLSTGDSSI